MEDTNDFKTFPELMEMDHNLAGRPYIEIDADELSFNNDEFPDPSIFSPTIFNEFNLNNKGKLQLLKYVGQRHSTSLNQSLFSTKFNNN